MQDDCKIIGCLLDNPLISDQSKDIQGKLILIDAPKNRIRYVIDLLQEKQPPKVNKTQINRYHLLRIHKGIDLDKDEVSAADKKYHAGLKHVPKKRKVKVDYAKGKSRIKKRFIREAAIQSALRASYVPGKIESATELLSREKNLYLQQQTPEQFDYAKKYGWMVAKMITEPEPNFHSE